ncbi:MAG: CARDB domain-containing protein, partial [Chitinophagales bacterium]
MTNQEIHKKRQMQTRLRRTKILPKIGWKSIIALLLTFLMLGGTPGVLSAGTINWTPKGISSEVVNTNPTADNQTNRLADMPLFFIENQGQIDKQVLYYTEGGNQALYFTPKGLTFALTKSQEPSSTYLKTKLPGKELIPQATEQERWAVKLNFTGAKTVKPHGEGLTPTRVSYLKGQQKDWKTGLNTYSRVVYPDLWPGIDLVFRSGSNGLKYEFLVAPGSDPKQIKLTWQGAESIKINKQGGMEIKTPIGGFTDQAPIAWQRNEEDYKEVDTSFCLRENSSQWGFELGNYDPARELVIDPAIIDYCGYIGGSREDKGGTIAVDNLGRIYVAAFTNSSESQGFPVTPGLDTSFNGGIWDGFVARMAADGASLEYCTYIGGSDFDSCDGIAVDSSYRVYITGNSASSESEGFPVKGGPDLTYNGGSSDSFVAQLTADGTSLEYCGYIGGSGMDYAMDVAFDNNGRVYLAGFTDSAQGLPVTGGLDSEYNGGTSDTWVARVVAGGSSLDYCGYIGGSNWDACYGLAVDNSGQAYVTGYTSSSQAEGFPASIGPDTSYNGGDYDAFVARVSADGNSLNYCGYIGGSLADLAFGIAVGSNSRAYVTGYTTSSLTEGFPVKVGPYTGHGGDGDAFVARVSADGTSLDYCGYIGGANSDQGKAIAVDNSDRAYVLGDTFGDINQGFPTRGGPDSRYNGGLCDTFVARVTADGTSLDYCGYIGGLDSDYSGRIAVDGDGQAYITGYTSSSENRGFPAYGGTDISYNRGISDIFVARVKVLPGPDLAVDLENPPTQAGSGEKVTVTAFITNMGENLAEKSTVQFYMDDQLL